MRQLRWLSGLTAMLLGCGADLPTEQDLAPLPDFVDRNTAVLFRAVTVLPMDGRGPLRNHTILVRDGRIAALGPTHEVTAPSDAVVLDGDGRYVMPGLADMHVHLVRQENMLLYLANGVTTIRNMWGSPAAVLGWREAVARGDLLGPRIYTASRGLDGSPPVWATTIVVDDPAAAAAAVEQETALGYDFIKVYNSLTPEAYDAVLLRAAELGIPVVGHVPRQRRAAEALDTAGNG